MSVTKVTTANSKEFLEAYKNSFVVLVFDAEFTGQQELVADAIKSLSTDLKDKIVLGTVDAEENNDLTTELSILSVPIIACLVQGKVWKKIDTLEPSKLTTVVKEELRKYELLSASTNDSSLQAENNNRSGAVDVKEKFNNYMKQLINRASVMIFMKGDPKTPRCGFSRQLIELLSRHNNVKYETFDILQDEEVRQGLKEYSDWPTYPQIYAKGEFVGGLDILKQLEESGELEATFL